MVHTNSSIFIIQNYIIRFIIVMFIYPAVTRSVDHKSIEITNKQTGIEAFILIVRIAKSFIYCILVLISRSGSF